MKETKDNDKNPDKDEAAKNGFLTRPLTKRDGLVIVTIVAIAYFSFFHWVEQGDNIEWLCQATNEGICLPRGSSDTFPDF